MCALSSYGVLICVDETLKKGVDILVLFLLIKYDFFDILLVVDGDTIRQEVQGCPKKRSKEPNSFTSFE